MRIITIDRALLERVLEALEKSHTCPLLPDDCENAITAPRAALVQEQAEPALQTCNCRWDGDVQVQQCTLHEAHVDAIHEWAERAKTAEKKLAALAQEQPNPPGCDHCNHPLYAATKCRVCGRVTA